MITQTILVTTLLSIIIGLLGFIARKLEKSLEGISREILISNERHNVSDVLFSTIFQDTVNTKHIAEGKLPWPKTMHKKKDREH